MCTVADLLIPLFTNASTGASFARRVARNALVGYQPETSADYVNVARTLAFSLSALALLGQAAAPDMKMPEKMRVFGVANALNRSADQSERAMMQRRRYQNIHAENQPTDPSPSESSDGLSAAEQAEVEAVVAKAVAACNPPFARHQTEPAAQPEAPAFSVAPPLMAGPAILHTSQQPANGPPWKPQQPDHDALSLAAYGPHGKRPDQRPT